MQADPDYRVRSLADPLANDVVVNVRDVAALSAELVHAQLVYSLLLLLLVLFSFLFGVLRP